MTSHERPALDLQADNRDNCPVREMFAHFQTELDCRYDKYERVVKQSRDITIESKRIIFQLHRVNDVFDREQMLEDVHQRLIALQNTKWRLVAFELQNEDHYQYLRAYSPGLQEFIEAMSFYYYLKSYELLSYQQLASMLRFTTQATLPVQESPSNEEQSNDSAEITKLKLLDINTPSPILSPSPPSSSSFPLYVNVPPAEFLMGIADLTGELMRLAIHSIGGRSDCSLPFELCQFMRTIQTAFVPLWNASREMPRKMTVLSQSLRKVEDACYALTVRGSELPPSYLADELSHSAPIQTFNDLIDDEQQSSKNYY